MLRINSGWAKSLALKTSARTKPTKSVARQALFDILRPLLADHLFIDLFAGSGAVGLEALANGVRGCVFVEQDRQAVQALRTNISSLRMNAAKQNLALGQVSCYRLSVAAFVRRYRFDAKVLVWADPPYSDCEHWGELISAQLQVGAGSYMCIERSVKSELSVHESWYPLKSRRYGRTVIDFFCKD